MSVSFPSEFGVSCPVPVRWGREVRNYNIIIITSILNFSSFLEKRPKLISPLTEGFQDKTNDYLFWLCLLTANHCVCFGISCSICQFLPRHWKRWKQVMGRGLDRAQYTIRTLASKENWLCRKLGLVWKVEVQWCVTEIRRKWAFSSVVPPTTLLKGRLKAFSFSGLERAFGELKKWRHSGRLFIGWTLRESIAADWGKIRWKNECLLSWVNKVFLLTHYLFLSTSLMYRVRTWLELEVMYHA